MCGITGFWQSTHDSQTTLTRRVEAMAEAIRHRGPDDGGVWVESTKHLALGNRRLAILDLSPEGHMPMLSHDGLYAITYNGECYNFAEVRKELVAQGVCFRSQGDTEVILNGFIRWGVEATLERLVGMFAFAFWNGKQGTLTLGRDRLGIKPLYYGWSNGTLLFGSELKSVRAHPDSTREIDRNSLTLLLRYSYIPVPYSIYKGFQKLPPGHTITFNSPVHRPQSEAYWDAREVVRHGHSHPFEGSEAEAQDALDALLRDAVRLRMISDVPLGAFLSGGVDSSTVVALMQAQSDRPVKTFSIGIEEERYNEAQYAKQVAKHLGTDHTELYVSPQTAQDVVPLLPAMYDEPFSDSSQIPTFLVSRLTREHVTVSLSGDGGDELFGGYNRYLLQKALRVPSALRRVGAKGLRAVSPGRWDKVYDRLHGLLPPKLHVRLPGDKLHKLADVLSSPSAEAMYQSLVSNWKSPQQVVVGASEPSTLLGDVGQWQNGFSFTELMMYLDLVTYLPDDILTKVDRASMAVSLEARVPVLDHRVVAFAWSLPLGWKVKKDTSKWMLRQVLYRYVPRELIERPKMGFGVPIDSWLRGPLKGWAEELIHPDRLKREEYFNAGAVWQKWTEHQSGKRNWPLLLWDVLMFQLWKDHWLQ